MKACSKYFKRLLSGLLLTVATANPAAAEELEYKMELGGALGSAFYIGDSNHTPFKNLSFSGGIIARYLLNSRMGIKANLGIGHIHGDNRDTFIPTDPNKPDGGQPADITFKRTLFDLGAQFELNLWGYGSGNSYKDTHRLTPYMLAGIGMTFATKPADITAAFNIPIGIGVKYKLKERINIGLEWTFRFSTSDALDVSNKNGGTLSHPYGIESKGFKNKDCYSFTWLYLTYDLFPKYRKCNN